MSITPGKEERRHLGNTMDQKLKAHLHRLDETDFAVCAARKNVCKYQNRDKVIFPRNILFLSEK